PTQNCLGTENGGLEDLIPGYCGPMYQDCLGEICIPYQPPLLPNGLPDNHLECTVDNPMCDAVLNDKGCTFSFRLCFNISTESRFACRARGPIGIVWLHQQNENNATGFNVANRDAFEAALIHLGGTISTFDGRSIPFNPPLQDTVCTAPILW